MNRWVRVAATLALVFCAGVFLINAAVPDDLLRRDVRVVTSLRGVDPAVQAALTGYFKDDPRLTDRGEPFSAGEAVRQVPLRQFILAAEVPTVWFIHYEHGGIGHHTHLIAFRRWGNNWRLAYAGVSAYDFNTLDRLRNAIRTHQFRQNMTEF